MEFAVQFEQCVSKIQVSITLGSSTHLVALLLSSMTLRTGRLLSLSRLLESFLRSAALSAAGSFSIGKVRTCAGFVVAAAFSLAIAAVSALLSLRLLLHVGWIVEDS